MINNLFPPALATLVVLTACAPARVAGPGPVPDPPVAEVESVAAGPVEQDSSAPDDDIESRLVVMARTARGPESPFLPIKPFGVSWSPSPEEGSAFGIVIHQRPTGRVPIAIEGEFAAGVVRFGLIRGQWFGIAAVPIGFSGPHALTLRMRFEDGANYEQKIDISVTPTSFASTNLSVDSRFSSPPADVLERIESEREMVRDLLETVTSQWGLDGPFQTPRPFDVTSPFGQARMFNGELRSRHTGLDLRGQTGAPVRSAGRGRVAFAGNLYFAGNAVYVDHGLGVYTGYFHLSRILVRVGDEVDSGDLVGEVGATGRVTAAHLHWYLSVSGQSLDAGSLLGVHLPE
ncbi:MAG: M23 family metallopeptidase [Gemmatimonadales bacterium]|nr:MAG: M23 family metallopeptidase [Gemmatimonadales bacterium]